MMAAGVPLLGAQAGDSVLQRHRWISVHVTPAP